VKPPDLDRSLVALSLILAMLLLKPAPIYILDEVDAALDLSHTQNIGGMLKEHFKHSQVSLLAVERCERWREPDACRREIKFLMSISRRQKTFEQGIGSTNSFAAVSKPR